MYAQRFGSLPIRYGTEGLAETIEEGKTGFLFRNLSLESFMGAVCRAFSAFGSKRQLNSMRRQAMTCREGFRLKLCRALPRPRSLKKVLDAIRDAKSGRVYFSRRLPTAARRLSGLSLLPVCARASPGVARSLYPRFFSIRARS